MIPATRAPSPPVSRGKPSSEPSRRSAPARRSSLDAPAEEPPIARGAEASIRRVDWLGFAAILKDRDPKSYRPKALDERLRKERTRNEARLLADARRAGVRTPLVYDVDLAKG